MAKDKATGKTKGEKKKEVETKSSKLKVVLAGTAAGVLVVAVAVMLVLLNNQNQTTTERTSEEMAEVAVEQPDGETEAEEGAAEGEEQIGEDEQGETGEEEQAEVETGEGGDANENRGTENSVGTGVMAGATNATAPKSYAEAMNSAALNPKSTGYALLDNQVMAVVNGYTDSNMQTTDKVLSLYRWVVSVIRLTDEEVSAEEVNEAMGWRGYSENDARAIYLAYKAFETGVGTEEQVAALFFVMTRKLGLESYMAETTGMVVVKVAGQSYSFEPGKDMAIGTHSVEYLGKDATGVSVKAYNNFAK